MESESRIIHPKFTPPEAANTSCAPPSTTSVDGQVPKTNLASQPAGRPTAYCDSPRFGRKVHLRSSATGAGCALGFTTAVNDNLSSLRQGRKQVGESHFTLDLNEIKAQRCKKGNINQGGTFSTSDETTDRPFTAPLSGRKTCSRPTHFELHTPALFHPSNVNQRKPRGCGNMTVSGWIPDEPRSEKRHIAGAAHMESQRPASAKTETFGCSGGKRSYRPPTTDPILQRSEEFKNSGVLVAGDRYGLREQPVCAPAPGIATHYTAVRVGSGPNMLASAPADAVAKEVAAEHSKLTQAKRHQPASPYHETAAVNSSRILARGLRSLPGKNASSIVLSEADSIKDPAARQNVEEGRQRYIAAYAECHAEAMNTKRMVRDYRIRDHQSSLALKEALYDTKITPPDLAK